MSEQPQASTGQVAAAAYLAEVERQRQEQLDLIEQWVAVYFALWATIRQPWGSGALDRWFASLVSAATVFSDAGWEMYRGHYAALRRMAGVEGPMPDFVNPGLDVDEFLRAQQAVVVNAFTRMEPRARAGGIDQRRAPGAGVAERSVLTAGRQLVHQAAEDTAQLRDPAQADPPANRTDRMLVGYMRVTDGDPCSFCALLASRGAVYVTPNAALYRADGERYHPDCACKVVPLWTTDPPLPPETREWRDLWERSQEEPPDGERLEQQKPRDEDGAADVAGRRARNNFRRLLAARRRAAAAAARDAPT